VFLFGHGLLLLLYASLITAATHSASVIFAVVLLGGYYAATDGVVVALASEFLPVGLRGSGLALLATATSVSRLVASISFGWIWTMWGRETAIVLFGVALGLGVTITAVAFQRDKSHG
jgi:MFS family permease